MEQKKTAIVTGATGAIGIAIARQLLTTGNYHVIMVVKDEIKAERIRKEIILSTKMDDITFYVTDLSRKAEVFHLADVISEPLHLLVNNAACTPRKRIETPEGIEKQFATNVLGYFWMMEAFIPHLKAGSPSRIVNVASYWAGGLQMDDLEFRSRRYHNDDAYRQSKQADRMLTMAFSEKLKHSGITVNACHPGDVNSTLSNNLGFGGHETPDQGARTPVWLATSPDLDGVTGKYFEALGEVPCQFSRDMTAIEKLFEICQEY
jgi:retinol dehydrogenase-13